jgi:hypothetical protein
MAGPYPPEYGGGPIGPQMPRQQFSGPPGAEPYPEGAPYPGMLPPPVSYPRRRRWPLITAAVLAVLVIAALATALVVVSHDQSKTAASTLSDSAAKAAIQQYLDALTNGDDATVARNALCGMFDEVKERRSDLALASLSSDAFRKQYSRAEVASIDKIVQWSPNQAQVLFTMRVEPARGAGRGQPGEEQAVAQLLIQDKEILVCSYLPRTAGRY